MSVTFVVVSFCWLGGCKTDFFLKKPKDQIFFENFKKRLVETKKYTSIKIKNRKLKYKMRY